MVALLAKCRTIAGENRARSSAFCKHAEEMALTGRKWLGDLDSNQDSQIQNLESYRWTISQLLVWPFAFTQKRDRSDSQPPSG